MKLLAKSLEPSWHLSGGSHTGCPADVVPVEWSPLCLRPHGTVHCQRNSSGSSFSHKPIGEVTKRGRSSSLQWETLIRPPWDPKTLQGGQRKAIPLTASPWSLKCQAPPQLSGPVLHSIYTSVYICVWWEPDAQDWAAKPTGTPKSRDTSLLQWKLLQFLQTQQAPPLLLLSRFSRVWLCATP